MKLEIKEIDGVPVTGIPDGSRTDILSAMNHEIMQDLIDSHTYTPVYTCKLLIKAEKSHSCVILLIHVIAN